MQIKKILGILLAVCFLMSVTAAAVSAAEPGNLIVKENKKIEQGNVIVKENKKIEQGNVIVKNYKEKKVVKGQWEWKLVKQVVIKNHHRFVISKWIKVWIPAHSHL